ncbi:hypothetical protein DQ237_10280 [Blastococcus sp. TF02-8]|uniref:hypothetical protein n=1 Tax=Blastococcus sp. TF02-8 TaxID=2250574 RepID=UPI000DEA61D7|nr:hypothetical protein [Blastococcus sp. TF02-8]RBY96240.1 hypothetical protein DQ237_10280 [Blastococcus sp. TF02-8]
MSDAVGSDARLPGVRVLLRRTWWALLAAAIGVGAGLGLDVLRAPVYESTAYLVVAADDVGQAGDAARSAQALARLATSPGIVSGPLRVAGQVEAAEDPRSFVLVQAAPDAPVVSVTGRAADAAGAQRTAATVVRTLVGLDAVEPFDTALVAAPPLPEQATVPVWLVPAGGGTLGAALGLLLAATVPPRPRRRRTGAAT